jgi:hypothetical protein
VHLVRALDLWDEVTEAERPPGVERVDVLARAAEATAWSGSPQRPVELASAALELVDEVAEPARAGRQHERRGYYLWWQGRGEDGISHYEEAVHSFLPSLRPAIARSCSPVSASS